jgi:hypothetical protein
MTDAGQGVCRLTLGAVSRVEATDAGGASDGRGWAAESP